MGALTKQTPKSLIEIHGKPILWYIFWTLYTHGIRDFVLPLGYKGKEISEYFSSLCSEMNCRMHACDTGEDTQIAGRIAQVSNLIPDGYDFLLLNSDTIFDFNIEEMHELHKSNKALVTLSSVDIVTTWGLILKNADSLVGFDRQRQVQQLSSGDNSGEYGLINSGIAWINKEALKYIDLEKCADFETTLYQRIIDIKRAAHYVITGYWHPIDTPKDLQIINLRVDSNHDKGTYARRMRDRLVADNRKK